MNTLLLTPKPLLPLLWRGLTGCLLGLLIFASCKKDESPVGVSSVTVNPTTISIPLGDTATLTASVLPEDAENTAVAWESDKTDIATVDAAGRVIALKIGSAIITATTEDGGKSASCTVTVTPVSAAGITLSQKTKTLTIGDTFTLIATVTPPNAANKAVTWESDKEDIATVDENGRVTALNVGIATITATTTDGNHTAFCTVTVNPITVSGINLNKAADTLAIGDTITLIATVTPPNATNPAVTWESDKEDIATVDENGRVTALNVGIATITATTTDGEKTDACTITVLPQVIMIASNTDQIKANMMYIIGTGTATVLWGDGSKEEHTLGDSYTFISHDYAATANYTITINGNITKLFAVSSQLTSINVSNCPKLEDFNCANNQLTSLDVTHNTALKILFCGDNQLTTLNLSHNTALTELMCINNQLATLDMSANTALIMMDCSSNKLTSINVSGCTVMTRLSCNDNLLTSLNVTLNKGLLQLGCSDNQLTGINVSKNTSLTYLRLSDNQLTSLDVSTNTRLAQLYCIANALTAEALDALFGTLHNNAEVTMRTIYIRNNPGAILGGCDKTIANAKGWTVNVTVSS